MKKVFVCGALALLAACPNGKRGGFPAPAKLSTVDEVVARLAQLRDARTSFRAESVMDYWLGDERLKGTVLVMGTNQRQVRFNAISPASDVMADMACDGTNFTLVNMQQNCVLAGPCNGQSIATFLRVELEPEDMLHLALGTVPVLPSPTGSVEWDHAKGHERVKLTSSAGTQTIVIDRKEGRFDVVASEQRDPAGNVTWSVENTDFESVKDEAGGAHRLPGKIRFKSPGEKADLLVEWKQRVVNPKLDPAKFQVNVPAGLPSCK